MDWTGVKAWYVGGGDLLTPWATKEKRRRRAANKVAKRARKRNR